MGPASRVIFNSYGCWTLCLLFPPPPRQLLLLKKARTRPELNCCRRLDGHTVIRRRERDTTQPEAPHLIPIGIVSIRHHAIPPAVNSIRDELLANQNQLAAKHKHRFY